MKLRLFAVRKERASTMVMVLVLSAATLLILASTLGWTSTNVTLTARNNEYFRTLAAAEAATEKVIAAIEWDYQAGGDATVLANLDNYRARVPTAAENPIFGNYAFNDAQNNGGRTYLAAVGPAKYRVLAAEYRDLYRLVGDLSCYLKRARHHHSLPTEYGGLAGH